MVYVEKGGVDRAMTDLDEATSLDPKASVAYGNRRRLPQQYERRSARLQERSNCRYG
jgi:hypothetical protein